MSVCLYFAVNTLLKRQNLENLQQIIVFFAMNFVILITKYKWISIELTSTLQYPSFSPKELVLNCFIKLSVDWISLKEFLSSTPAFAMIMSRALGSSLQSRIWAITPSVDTSKPSSTVVFFTSLNSAEAFRHNA